MYMIKINGNIEWDVQKDTPEETVETINRCNEEVVGVYFEIDNDCFLNKDEETRLNAVAKVLTDYVGYKVKQINFDSYEIVDPPLD